MATVFKGTSINNISNVTLQTLYTAPAATITSLTSLLFSNKTTAGLTVSLQVVRSGGTLISNVLTNANIPIGAAIEAISNKPIVLNTGDYIQAQTSVITAADATISYMEQT